MIRPAHILRLAAAALGAMALGADAWAAPDLTPAFKGTIVSTYPSGRSARLWLNPDGTFTGLGAKGAHYAGVWKLKGDSFCMRQTKPLTLPLTFCQPMPAVGPDGTWASKSPKGEPLTNRLEPGR